MRALVLLLTALSLPAFAGDQVAPELSVSAAKIGAASTDVGKVTVGKSSYAVKCSKSDGKLACGLYGAKGAQLKSTHLTSLEVSGATGVANLTGKDGGSTVNVTLKVRDIKEKLAYVAMDYDEELAEAE